MVVPGTDPIDRLARRPIVCALHLLPVLLFVGLAIGAWVRETGESHSAWLQEAQALSAELRAFGPGALGMARTWADPRVPPSVALLSMGLS
ncbi:MAG: hypothetical protein V1774_05350, partial [Candidatus Eisenbacteria bacterium]